MQESEYKYILIPLPMIREIFCHPECAVRDIFYVGAYQTASSQDIDLNNAIKQILYCYYRNKPLLTTAISSKLDQLVDEDILDIDEDYNGFYGESFEADQEMECLSGYLINDIAFKEEIIEFHKLRQVSKILNVNFNIPASISIRAKYSLKYNNFEGCPMFSLKTSMLIDFLDEKREFQLAIFAIYAGIKSIIGNKDYAQTTRVMICNRMFGAKNNIELKEVLKDKGMQKMYEKYSKRYWIEKLIDHLLVGNFLASKIGCNRRTYVSCKLNHKELSRKIVEKSAGTKRKLISKKEAEAKQYILQHLNK